MFQSAPKVALTPHGLAAGLRVRAEEGGAAPAAAGAKVAKVNKPQQKQVI